MRATILIAVALAWAAPAVAQGRVYVNPYVGYYAFDESSFEDAVDGLDIERSPIVGARLGWTGGAWGIEAAYGRAGFDAEGAFGDIVERRETTIHLFYAALTWGLPLGPVEPFVSGGLGAARYDPDRTDGTTDFVANFGAGARLDLGRVALRVDAKDHVDLCQEPDFAAGDDVGACFDDETLHNIEISGGVEIGL